MRRIDLITACVMLVLSGMVLAESRALPFWSEFAPGSAFMPVLVAAAGAGLAVLLGLQAWREAGGPAHLPDAAGFARAVSTMAGLWGVVVLTPWLGLLPAAVLFMVFLLLVVLRRPLLPSLFATALTSMLIWGVFIGWLGVALPRGPLGI